MGKQQSSIDLLPDAVRDQLNELLRDRKVTQKDAVERINQILAEMQHPERLSKSAVNRYALQMEKVGRRMRESREMAEVWIGKFGSQPQGQVGNLINEMLRTLSFDISLILQEGQIDDESAPAIVGMLKDLALTSMRLEKAANLNVEREKEIRQQALADAAKTVDQTARKAGVTPETIALIHEALGING
jgi:hypothetical protein